MDKFKKKFLKKNWLKIAHSLSMILLTAVLLTYVSYSWIKRDWSPRIEQSGITIATGNTLSFVFDETATMEKTLDELLGIQDFKLKSVSNATGRSGDFFSLSVSAAGNEYATLHHISRTDIANPPSDLSLLNTELGKQFGYVDLQFTVQAPNNDESGGTRYVYIDPTSVIENLGDVDVVSAIRISITLSSGVGDVTQGTTYILGSSAKPHQGISSTQLPGTSTVKYVVDGVRRDSGLTPEGALIPTSEVIYDGVSYPIVEDYGSHGGVLYTFADFNGGPNQNDPSKTLFPLEDGQQQTITVRIWAEGEDPSCTSVISGESFNLKLKFSAMIV